MSVTKRGESAGAKRKRGSDKLQNPTSKKARPGDLGRALRSVYDDTLRETVPDEFISLLGKLS